MRKNMRFAGARLAILPIEDVTEDLKVAIENLQTARGLSPMSWTEKVPGVDADVSLHIEPYRAPEALADGAHIYGNSADIARLKDVNTPGAVSLSWHSDRPEAPKDRVKVARFANEMWEEALKDLPDGTVVVNSPVGASHGDFERADLYARQGFGPVQTDGQQFGVMEDGHIKPLSPFIADPDYLRDLGRRAKAAGKTDLEAQISRALSKRSELDIYSKDTGFESPHYDNDYYDYDPDFEEREPITRADVKRRVEAAAQPRDSNNGSTPVEIRIRQAAERPSWAGEGDYELTGDDIALVRQAQIDALQTPDTARDQADVILQYADRPLPGTPPTVDRGWLNSHRILEQIEELPPEQRRAAVIEEILHRQANDVSTTGFDHDPSVVRDLAKQATMNIVDRPGGEGLIAQELYDSNDVAALRRWQEAQALNFPVSNPNQTPPPTLGPNGQIVSERLSPPDAVVAGSSNAMLSTPAWREQVLPDMEVVEHRRMLTPDQQAAMRELESLQSVGNQRPDIARAINGLNDAVSDREMRIGSVLRELYEGEIPALERRMRAQPASNATEPRQVSRDLQTVNNSFQQPGRVEGRELAQALANLRQVAGEPLTPAQQRRVQELQQELSGVSRGPAAPINRVYLQRDQRPNELDLSSRNRRW